MTFDSNSWLGWIQISIIAKDSIVFTGIWLATHLNNSGKLMLNVKKELNTIFLC